MEMDKDETVLLLGVSILDSTYINNIANIEIFLPKK